MPLASRHKPIRNTTSSAAGEELPAKDVRATRAGTRSSIFDLIPLDRQQLWRAVLIVAVGCWVFWPALHGSWISDDEFLITYNRDLRDVHGLVRSWLATPASDYWPLTWTFLWAGWHLWGNHPFPYHVCNLLLHLGSAFLLWKLLARLGLRQAWLGGLLFVVHPLVVESVAWVSEIKNTLSLPFFLLSLDAFLDAEQGARNGSLARSICYYLAAMLCKTSTVMLPLVLLLYLWWKEGRITGRDLRRVWPYFAIALALGWITLHFQHVHTPQDMVVGSRGFATRVVGAGVVVCFYLEKFLFPFRLLPVYPRWSVSPPTLLQALTVPSIIGVLTVFWVKRRGWGRHALLGTGFFLLNLFPVVGFIDMALMNITWVADHLVYLPMIGLIGLGVAGLEAVARTHSLAGRRAVEAALLAAGCSLAWSSHEYARCFVDEGTLWTYALRYNPTSWDAHTDMGKVLLRRGRVPEALAHFETALRIRPELPQSHNDVADALARSPGRLPEAIAEYQRALQIDADYPKAQVSLALALDRSDRRPDAIAHLREALRLDPNDFRAHYNLANLLAASPEDRDAAIAEYRAALQLNSDSTDAHNNLGGLLTMIPERMPEAVTELRTAIQLTPNFSVAHRNLAYALSKMPDGLPEAIKEYEIALRLAPDDLAIRYNLAEAMAAVPGRAAEAIPLLEAILRDKPDFEPAERELQRLRPVQK